MIFMWVRASVRHFCLTPNWQGFKSAHIVEFQHLCLPFESIFFFFCCTFWLVKGTYTHKRSEGLKGFFSVWFTAWSCFFSVTILFQLELLHREFFLFFLFFTPAQGRNRYLLEIRRCQIHVAPHLCVNILKSAEILRCPALNYCCYSLFFLIAEVKAPLRHEVL